MIEGILVAFILVAPLIASANKQAPSVANVAHADQLSSRIFAPYMDTSLYSTQVTSLTNVKKQAGVYYYTLAFMLNGGGTCNAEWNGDVALDKADDPTQKSIGANIESNINDLRSNGGDAIISFGGANGTELAQSCTDVGSLEQQYLNVVTKYEVIMLDFDIEGGALSDQASIDRRNQALAALQAQDGDITIDYTLPVLPTGLTQDGLNVLKSAIKYHVNVNIVNGMAMDYGSGPDPNPSPGKMGDMAEQVGQSLHDQLKTLYSDKTDAQLWSMVGITPMIGQNDNQQEIFTIQDANELEGWAKQHNIGLLSFWSLARDTACSGGSTGSASPTCSDVSQQPFDFSKIFNMFAGTSLLSSSCSVASSTVSPTATVSSTATPIACPRPTATLTVDLSPTTTLVTTSTAQGKGIQAWVGNNSNPPLYNPGDEVTYNGHTYKCLRQIWGETQWPPDAPGIADNFWQQIS